MRQAMIVALLLVLAGFGACASTPDEPTFDNPFDPNGTNPGEGYGLTVAGSGQAVVLTWDNLPGIYGYLVEWSDESSAPASWTVLDEQLLPPGGSPVVLFAHEDFTTEKTNWYRITGYVEVVDSDGVSSGGAAVEPSVPVGIDIEALVSPAGGEVLTGTREIEIEVRTGVADGVEISNDSGFAASTVFTVVPGELTTVPWTLPVEHGPGDPVQNQDQLIVYYRTNTATSTGPRGEFSMQVVFGPILNVDRGLRAGPAGFYMVDSLQVLSVAPTNGQSIVSVVRNRWNEGSSTWDYVEDLTPASVSDPINVFWDPAVEELIKGQIVAKVLCDFGFEVDATRELLVPTSVGEPVIEIVGGSYTTSRDIQVASTASNAGYLIVSEDAEFIDATWVTWVDTLDYQLEDVFGTRFFYAAYTNPILAETKVTSTLISLVSPPARVRH